MDKRKLEKLVNGNIAVTIPVRLKYDGHKTVLLKPDDHPQSEPQQLSPLQKAVIQGHQYRDQLESGQVRTVTELARKENVERAFLFRSLSLVNLAPDLLEAIMNGTEPQNLTLTKLKRGFPEHWQDQRQLFSTVTN